MNAELLTIAPRPRRRPPHASSHPALLAPPRHRARGASSFGRPRHVPARGRRGEWLAAQVGARGAGDGLTVRPASARSSGSVYDLRAVVFDGSPGNPSHSAWRACSRRVRQTGRDPGVVRWPPGPTAHLSTGLKFAPGSRHGFRSTGSTSSWDMNPRRSSVRRGPQCRTSVRFGSVLANRQRT